MTTDMRLLTSYEIFEYSPEKIKESRDRNGGKIIMKGILQKADTLNQNGRIYPLHVLEREIRNYQKLIIENRALGECVPPGTEIMTRDGWKNIENISEGETIATINIETGNIEYQRVKNKIDKEYSGMMLHIKNRSTIDMKITPDHRILVWDRKHVPTFIKGHEFLKLSKENSSWLSHCSLRRAGNWVGDDVESIHVPGVGEIDSTLWAAFLGIYIAEGFSTGTVSGIKRNNCVRICQSQRAHPDIWKDINDLLITMKLKFHSDEKGFSINGGEEFHAFMFELGNSHNKHIPLYAKSWSPRLLNILLEWMLKGDGRNRCRTDGTLINELATSSKQLADDTCELMLKLGNGASVREYQPEDRPAPDYNETGRMILSENSHKMYCVYMHVSSCASLDRRFLSVEEIPYEGRVYCVTVDNGTWLMRSNGKTFWTGNCDHPDESVISLKNVSHVVREAYLENSVVYGTVELLDTPSGKILQSLVESGVKLGISSRGVGSTKKQGDYVVVQDDFQLICFDYVSEPSTPNAFLLPEGKAISNTSAKDIFNKSDRINRIVSDILFKRE